MRQTCGYRPWGRHLISGLALALAAVLTVPAHAGWFDTGLELLKGFTGGTTARTLSLEEIAGGLKEALRVGSGNVVTTLGKTDGFNLDPDVHIPLPEQLNTVKTMLGKVGLSSLMDDLELKLNRAAEAATPKAKSLFVDAIARMTFEDVEAIFKGPDDAATRYFRNAMSPELAAALSPIVDQVLADVGAIQAYDKVMGRYQSLPFVPDIKADLNQHVVNKGMAGIFLYMAREEAAIRKDPAKRTTEILRRVFGAS